MFWFRSHKKRIFLYNRDLIGGILANSSLCCVWLVISAPSTSTPSGSSKSTSGWCFKLLYCNLSPFLWYKLLSYSQIGFGWVSGTQFDWSVDQCFRFTLIVNAFTTNIYESEPNKKTYMQLCNYNFFINIWIDVKMNQLKKLIYLLKLNGDMKKNKVWKS